MSELSTQERLNVALKELYRLRKELMVADLDKRCDHRQVHRTQKSTYRGYRDIWVCTSCRLEFTSILVAEKAGAHSLEASND